MWLIAIAAAALIPSGKTKRPTAADQLGTLDASFTWNRARLTAAVSLVLLLAFGIGSAKELTEENLQEAVASALPEKAVAFVQERGYTGPLFNDFNWGGYLMWQLPQLKVSIDGQANLHGDERIQQSFDTWSALTGWERDPELTAANVIIANKETALAACLRADQQFDLVFEDDVAARYLFGRWRLTPQAAEAASSKGEFSHA